MTVKTKIRQFAALLLLSALMFSGCTGFRKGDTTVLMKIGDVEITAEMYHYVYMKNATLLYGDSADPSSLNEEETKLLNEAVLTELKKYCAIETLAKKYGVSLSGEELKEIKKQLKAGKKEYKDKNDYYAELEKRYMTENVLYLQTCNYYLDRNLFYHLTQPSSGIILLSDKMLHEDIEKYFYAAIQIYIADKTDGTKILNALKERAQKGERFEDLAAEFSEDSNKGIRYFTTGEMMEFFENAVSSLKIGEISEVIESDMGVHLILRCPLDAGYIDKHLEEFRDTDLVRIYHQMTAEEIDSFTVEYTEKYKGLPE